MEAEDPTNAPGAESPRERDGLWVALRRGLSSLASKAGPSAVRRAATTLRFWVAVVIGAIVLIVVYYGLLDHFTPYTGDAYLQSYVVRVAPQVSGRVTTVAVKNNTQVGAGQPMFEIDPRPYEYRVNQLRAELAQAQQTVKELRSEIESASAQIAKQKADLVFAKRHYAEIRPLAEKQYAAQLQLQEVTDALRAKRALLRRAHADRSKSEALLSEKVDGEYAVIRQVEAELAKAIYDLEQTIVSAPFDGYVTNLQLARGEYLNVGDQVMTFVDSDNWWLVANFAQSSLERIKPGQNALVTLAIYPGKIFRARIESIDWGVSLGQGTPSGELPTVEAPKNWVRLTRRFPVRLRLHDLDRPLALRVGGTASVTVVTDEDAFIFNGLARLWLRIASYLNYLY